MNDFIFFSARELQLNYFKKLNIQLSSKIKVNKVISHKKISFSLINFLFWMRSPKAINKVIDFSLREKQNAKKHRSKNYLYWLIFKWIKTIEARCLYFNYLAYFTKTQLIILWYGMVLNSGKI